MKYKEIPEHGHNKIGIHIVESKTAVEAALNAHKDDKNDPHEVTKTQVGLSNVENIKVKLDAAAAPTVNDDSGNGYAVGSRWIDVTNDKEYTCLDSTVGAAVWTEITGGELLKADGTRPLTAEWATGNFNIKGLSTIYVSSTAPTSPYTNMLWQDTTVATRFLLKRWSGTAWISVYSAETVSRTINVNNSMSRAEIQTEIDAIGRNILAGVVITFQFADGIYTLTDQLYFTGFIGAGKLLVYGKVGDIGTTKAVHLDFSGQDCHGLYFQYNIIASISIYYLKIIFKTASDWRVGIYVKNTTSYIHIAYDYLLGTATSQGYGIYLIGVYGHVAHTYVSNMARGIGAGITSSVYSEVNRDTGIQPSYGLFCQAAIIFKGFTQPTGSTANELKYNGGQIF